MVRRCDDAKRSKQSDVTVRGTLQMRMTCSVLVDPHLVAVVVVAAAVDAVSLPTRWRRGESAS